MMRMNLEQKIYVQMCIIYSTFTLLNVEININKD